MITAQKDKIENERVKYNEMKKVFKKKRDSALEAIKEYAGAEL